MPSDCGATRIDPVVHEAFDAVIGDDARGHASVSGELFELFIEVGIPAQRPEPVIEVNGQLETLRI